MSLRVRIFFFAAAAPLVVACTALLGDFESNDAPSFAAPDSSALDSTVVEEDSQGSGDSALVHDGSLDSDGAPSDAGSDSTVSTVYSCRLTFDDGGVPADWSSNGPPVQVTDAASFSPPQSVVGTGGFTYRRFGLFDGGGGTLRISAMIRIPSLADGSTIAHPTLRIGTFLNPDTIYPGGGTQLNLVVAGSSTWSTSENGPEARGILQVAPDTFVSVRLEFHILRDGGMYAQAGAGDASLGVRTVVPADGVALPDWLFVGLSAGENFAEVYYDDVVVDVTAL